MPGPRPPTITLLPRQRAVLEHLARRATSPQRPVRRAQMLLATAAGAPNTQGATRLGLDRETVRLWRLRWQEGAERLGGAAAPADAKTLRTMIEAPLSDQPRPGPPATFPPEPPCPLRAVARP